MMFKVILMWDEESREVGWYDLKQECIECGTYTTAPTPIDWMDCD
jgi:rRNA maturation protein Nop10